jgi:hypothetical protein
VVIDGMRSIDVIEEEVWVHVESHIGKQIRS